MVLEGAVREFLRDVFTFSFVAITPNRNELRQR